MYENNAKRLEKIRPETRPLKKTIKKTNVNKNNTEKLVHVLMFI